MQTNGAEPKKPFLKREIPPAIGRIVVFLVLIATFVSLFSCSILDDLAGDGAVRRPFGDNTGPSVLDHIGEDAVAGFDRTKFARVERIFDNYSVYDYSDKETIAAKTLAIYREYFEEKIDLSDRTAVTDAMLYSFVEALGDKYAFYRTAEQYEDYETDMSGNFYGIGVLVHYEPDPMTVSVTEVYEDSPAEAAGFAVGDILLEVDGAALADLGYEAFISRVRGELGTEVKITVLRGEERIVLTAVRGPVQEKVVRYEIRDGIGYIALTGFKDVTVEEFAKAFYACKDAGVSGVIFDLRGNPGGYLTAVVQTISFLVPDGVQIVSFGDYASPISAKDGQEEDQKLTVPCVVLCNENTASAGELFTSSVRDFASEEFGYLTAKTVGHTTYGKGIMQSSFTMSDGSAVTLTVAFYNPPSGENYHGEGITPDYPVDDDPDTEEDEQYEKALEVLTGLIAEKSN